ncbi:general transcription factor IIF subunit 2 [Adelges cooleyi]|uniref:general transcription factor IIF subunit 2 n=1 Tax=Adelges cooleyi TaxID=133065 RepID=UPI0021802A07|nr:general transcription factor IIF subunit 2 [Adelges cooleyi]XP_050422660.1 general transcription factor IIF subunit 2 [Adelges cooleyi]XP_050422661.1 general transcription factor IIF subunit 2 [Adelges cooleyi]
MSGLLDVNNATTSLWLVKVPKYVADKWDIAPSSLEVGKIKVQKHPGKRPDISLHLSEAVLCLEGDKNTEPIPKSFKLDVSHFTGQTIGVLSEYSIPYNPDAIVQETDKLSIEGKISQKLECRPIGDQVYMDLKKTAIKKAHIPTRQVQKLDKVVQNFKPISDHKHNIEYNEKKKSEGKKARDDKDSVMAMLFKAFEKHQYYNIKDLVTLTKQPVVYLKEILKEVCNYNLKHPHKNMWELKPEYRHYKEQDEPMETS